MQIYPLIFFFDSDKHLLALRNDATYFIIYETLLILTSHSLSEHGSLLHVHEVSLIHLNDSDKFTSVSFFYSVYSDHTTKNSMGLCALMGETSLNI